MVEDTTTINNEMDSNIFSAGEPGGHFSRIINIHIVIVKDTATA